VSTHADCARKSAATTTTSCLRVMPRNIALATAAQIPRYSSDLDEPTRPPLPRRSRCRARRGGASALPLWRSALRRLHDGDGGGVLAQLLLAPGRSALGALAHARPG